VAFCAISPQKCSIGAGVRLPPQSLAVFEAVVNAIHMPLRLPPSPLIRGPKTAPMHPRDGCLPAESRRGGLRRILPSCWSFVLA